ncbi:MAG TPA: penicillin-binding protein activator [Aestuariivirga sp.]|nr:penicillin-binding protein activator [Aestuariivirga sp.]HRA95245.1 penicillin-binding protein activator [Aestuariivirga sp.]
MKKTSVAQAFMGREWRNLLAVFLLFLLAGCGGMSKVGDLFSDDPATPQAPPAVSTSIALLLPLSAPGETQNIARAMQQAAQLAVKDLGSGTLIIKDSGGTADRARSAAQAALDEGAGIILGPLLSTEVQAVSPVARERNVNVIAFSSVSSVATPGTFLMSFLPDEEVSNVVRYAASKGYRNISLLYPASQYGAAIEQALSRAALAEGSTVVAAKSYAREAAAVTQPAASIAASLGQGSALLLPEGGQMLRTVSGALEGNGISPRSTKILGTGLWDDGLTRSTPIAQGGWYAGVAPQLVQAFEQKYAASYGVKPPRIASLAYDAVAFAVNLQKTGDVSEVGIASPTGFQGSNGLFRFRENGLIERGLAILQMGPGGPDVIQQAPTSFSSPAQ